MTDTENGRPSGLSSDDGTASVSTLRASIPDADRLQELLDAKQAFSDAINELFASRGTNRIYDATEAEWDGQEKASDRVDRALEALLPTEQDAINIISYAQQRLKQLGWNDIIYCPKDGNPFDAIEVGSTGIHQCVYEGKWPKGSWWLLGDGDMWPSRPIMYRKTQAELDAFARLKAQGIEAQRAETLGSVHESPVRQDAPNGDPQ